MSTRLDMLLANQPCADRVRPIFESGELATLTVAEAIERLVAAGYEFPVARGPEEGRVSRPSRAKVRPTPWKDRAMYEQTCRQQLEAVLVALHKTIHDLLFAAAIPNEEDEH